MKNAEMLNTSQLENLQLINLLKTVVIGLERGNLFAERITYAVQLKAPIMKRQLREQCFPFPLQGSDICFTVKPVGSGKHLNWIKDFHEKLPKTTRV
jgi:hypothetical protein